MSINIAESFQKMSIGEKIILIAGPLLLIDSFLPWYDVDLGPFGSVTRSGWESPGALWSILAMLCGVVAAGLVAVTRFTAVKLPALPEGVSMARVYAGLGVAALLFVIVKWVNESDFLGFGFYLGVVLAIALAAGGVMMFMAERQGTSS